MARSRPIRRAFRRGVVLLGTLLLAMGVFFTQTPLGREMVLREILRRARGFYHGELTVEGISSPGLLRGFTLKGVALTGEDGRPFLMADSLMAGLSPRSLLAGDLIFSRVHFWSPDVVLERLPDQDRMNVVEIFRPRRDPDTLRSEGGGDFPEAGGDVPGPEIALADSISAAPGDSLPPQGRTVAFRRLEIHGGSLEILLPLAEPLPPGSRALVALDPQGNASLRRYSFREIDLALSETTVLTPLEEGETFLVESLAFEGRIWEDPFQISKAAGVVRRTRGRLHADLMTLQLPASEAGGAVDIVWGRPDGVRVEVQGETPGLALRDLLWIDPRLPDGIARGPFGFVLDSVGFLLDFRGTRLDLPTGRVRATGGLLLSSRLGLRNLRLELDGVELGIVDSWIPRPFPLTALVGGELNLSGSPGSLEVEGDVTLLRPDSTGLTDALFSGTLHLGDILALSDFQATLAPLEWSTFRSLSPRMTLQGPGALRLEANGSLREGITLDAEATHVPQGLSPSRVTARGIIGQGENGVFLDLVGDLGPLSFTTLRRDFPDLPLTGEIAGSVRLGGLLSALTMETDLTTSAGPLSFTAAFDARNPLESYQVDADVQEFLLSSLVPSLPEPTRLTGRILAQGRGVALDSLEVEATAFLRRGEIGQLRVDTAALVARVHDGLLTVDALMAETSAGRFEGGGSFGVSSQAPAGELTVRVESESLEGLRPFIMGETPVVFEDLSALEKDWLIMGGADLDTIPRAEEVALDGAVRGQAVFRGGLSDFSGEGSLSFQGLRYRRDFMERGTLTFSARSLPGPDLRVEGHLWSDSLLVYGQSFMSGEVEADLGRSDGRIRLTASRKGNEEYRARGTFALDSLNGGQVNLDEVLIRFDTVRWNLGGPSSVSWNDGGIDVRDFRLIRPGVGGMRIQAHGFLPFKGEGDFELDVDGLHLDRIARISQIPIPLEGVFGIHLRRMGTAEEPLMEGTLSGSDLRYGDLSIGGLVSEFRYSDRALSGRVEAQESGNEVLAVEGTFPMDLRFRRNSPLVPEAPVDLAISVQDFPAALALAVIEAMEQVQGTLTGEMQLRGTPRDLEPTGRLELQEGAVHIPALGVRYRNAQAVFTLNPDALVEVEGSLRAEGRATVRGSVRLSPITNPGLDLVVTAENFRAASRRDVEARVSGEVRVLQTYRRPRVEGRISVDQGELRVEELARSAEVVNLYNPLFVDVGERDPSLPQGLNAPTNPFLQNLMLDVEMRMGRGSWLRGRDLNVEMGGDLQVFWDRTERDLALVGELQAIRGAYTFWNRQFQVQEGTVAFLGTPGVNPNLDIQAQHRLRIRGSETLNIIATVSGTLLEPRVALSSDASFAIAESDLVSYLIFGRPSYDLASGEKLYAEGVAGSLLGAAVGSGANLALGSLSNQLGAFVARDMGLDFLAITQEDYFDLGGLGSVASTQVEFGRYITDDVYAALLWRPLTDLAAADAGSQFAGLRVEWRVADLWTLEGFVEDRYSRSPVFRAGSLGYLRKKVPGFFFWREWGY